jgi:hypothetical protein
MKTRRRWRDQEHLEVYRSRFYDLGLDYVRDDDDD